MKNKTSTLKILMVVVAISILVIVGFLLIVGFIFMKYGDFGVSSNSNHEKKYYQLFEQNSNRSFVGMVSLNKILPQDQFISFNGEDGTQHLISNFGSNEYQCIGSCYCESFRRSAGVLTKGLSVLVAAVSTIVAVNIARETLKKECVQKFAEECEEDSIKSEVEDCKDVKNEDTVTKETKETKSEEAEGEEKKSKENVEEEDEEEVHECYGRCKLKPDDWLEVLKISFIGWMEKRAMKKCQKMEVKAMMHYKPGESRLRYYGVETKFRETFLNDFCMRKSREHCVGDFPRDIQCTKIPPERIRKTKIVAPEVLPEE